MKLIYLGLAAAMSAAVPQPAAAQQNPPGGDLVTSFNELLLVETMTTIGGKVREGPLSGETQTYTMEFQNGLVGFGFFAACTETCGGLVIAASFETPEDMTADQRAKIINDFNADHAELKVFMGTDGDPLAQNYLIANGGISKQNMQTQIGVFAESAKLFADAFYADFASK